MQHTNEDLGFVPPDYLDSFDRANFERDAILHLRQERQPSLFANRMDTYQKAAQAVQAISCSTFDFSDSTVRIGTQDDLTEVQRAHVKQLLETFCPWKKGPFDFFGTPIDAEWRSDWKWDRIQPHIQPLSDRKVADIGCHNGYFMFRMAAQNPLQVIGFEPVAKHFWNFQLIQNLVQQENLAFELLGVEHVDLYPNFFDTIFCLGILYHHTDPVGLLRKMHKALSHRGEIIIDCQGIPGNEPVALTPRGRYAQARGIWFLPTQSCLEHWITRAGFTKLRCIFAAPLSTEEQRRTPWANINSLSNFLNPNDASLTIEGYPAPWRYYIVAQRG